MSAVGDARKRLEQRVTLEETIARHLHVQWCDVGKCSYGGDDYDQAVTLAEVVRAHVAAGGAL